MLCLTQHQSEPIKYVCINEECHSVPTVCDHCFPEHDGHNIITVNRFKYSMQKFMDSIPAKNDKAGKEQARLENKNSKMQSDLECAAQSIFRLNQRLQKMSQFMNQMYETMMSVEDNGEEQDLVSTLLGQLETSQDLPNINKQFSSMFLLMQAVRQPEPNTGKMELCLAPTQIAQIRTQSVLDRMFEFSKELKTNIEQQESSFSEMLGQMGSLLRENKQFINLEQQGQGNQVDVLGIDVKNEEREMFKDSNVYKEVLMVRDLVGIEKCDTPEPFQGSKKQMMKLCNYWIFYYNIVCDGNLLEPNQNDIPLKKGKKLLPVIRCAFCKLITQKEFKQGYFRYDPVKKFGELSLFKDEQGREISVHEMCMLWSNRVSINLETFQADLNTIVMAVQYARTQLCRYCGCVGASLKCNRPECHVHFHFSCLKQVRLMGMQLDFEAKYRFFCEDHVIRINQYESDWFITRIRLMHIIQAENQLMPSQGGPKPTLTEEDMLDDESMMEDESRPQPQKKGKHMSF